MKQILLKTWLIVVCLLFGVGTLWATDVTFNPSSDKAFPKDGITLSVTDGTLTNGTDYRVYKNQTMTISSTVGNITNIALTYSDASYDGGGWAASYQPNATSWTSPTANGEQARITKIVVTVSGSNPTKYGITVNPTGIGDTGNGLSVNGTYYSSYQHLANAAAAGETITLTASPKAGYKATADCWNVLQGTTPVSVTGSGNNYSFTMPAGNVSISPVYVAESATPTPDKLGTPSNLSATNITATSANLSWDAVANASSYELTVLDDQAEYVKEAQSVSGTSYNLTGLTANTTYTWSVKAIGDGVNYTDSDDSGDIDFTTETEQGGGEEPGDDNPSREEATMAAGTNGSEAKVNDKDAIKVGTSNKGGDMTITVPAGATSLEFYAAAWSGVTGLSLNITPAANVSPTSVSLTADTGISSNSPFTLSGTESSYKFTIALSNITTETTLTLTSSAAKRFVVWGATYTTSGGGSTPEPEKITPTLSFASATATAYLDALSVFAAPELTTDPENLAGVTYSMTGDVVGTINASTGELNLTAAGTATIIASYAGDGVNYNAAEDASYTLTVNANVPEKTIAEFIASEGGICYLTGTVSNIAANNFGNFDLTDETGTIYVYGCLTPEGQKQQFNTLGVVVGDKIKVLANEYTVFNDKKEALNVIFVEEIEIEKTKYTVTIETPENGTLVVKDGEKVLASGDQVEEGNTITIECTPTDAENYRYKNWQYKEDGNWITMEKTMTRVVTKDISIRANFELIPTYTINWSVNGVNLKTDENVKQGTALTAPEVSAINGKNFTGWVTTPTVDADATPDYVTPTTATADATYYAVFADGEGGGETKYKLVESALDNWTGDYLIVYNNTYAMNTHSGNQNANTFATYTDISEYYTEDTKSIASNSSTDALVYRAVQTTNGYSLYCVSDESYLGITSKTTSTGAKLRWNTTYTESADDWTLGVGSVGNVGSNTLYIRWNNNSGSYRFAAYASNGQQAIQLFKKEGGATYSDYTTAPFGTATITIAAACTDGETCYSTYSNASAFVVPEGLTVSTVGIDGDGKLDVMSYKTGDVVAENTGVMVSGAAGDHVVILTNAAATDAPCINNLHPSSELMTGDNLFYRLTMHNGKTIGFWWGAAEGAAFSLAANKAYLAVPKSAGSNLRLWFGDETITGIDTVETTTNDAIFNLQGQRINRVQKGVNIVNGKKVIR